MARVGLAPCYRARFYCALQGLSNGNSYYPGVINSACISSILSYVYQSIDTVMLYLIQIKNPV